MLSILTMKILIISGLLVLTSCTNPINTPLTEPTPVASGTTSSGALPTDTPSVIPVEKEEEMNGKATSTGLIDTSLEGMESLL